MKQAPLKWHLVINEGVLYCVFGSDPAWTAWIHWAPDRVTLYTCMTWGCKYPHRFGACKVDLRKQSWGFSSLWLRVQTSVITPNGIKQERGWYIIIHNVACSRDCSPLTSSRIISTASRWGLCNAKRRHGLPCLQGSLGNFSPPATRAALPERLRPETYFT